MTITNNQLKGNWGEDYIASNLVAKDCFVRHVTQGLDTGIDLYCETIKNGEPFLHFWCQVKTKKKWSGDEKEVSIDPSDIEKYREYWLCQPVPVFIFCVPDKRDQYPPYYICSAFDYWMLNSKKSFLKIEYPENLLTFLNEYLPIQTFLWDLKNGKVTSLKITPKPESTLLYPSGFAQEFQKELFRSLTITLWRLNQDILFHEVNPKDVLKKSTLNDDELKRFLNAEPYMKALEILTVGKKDQQYQNYATIGVYYELKKEYGKSLYFYKESLSIINKNPDLDKSNPPWKDVIASINEHIKRVNSKMDR